MKTRDIAFTSKWVTDRHHRMAVGTTSPACVDPGRVAHMIGRTRIELARSSLDEPLWQDYQRMMDARQPIRGFTYCNDLGDQIAWVTIDGDPRYGRDGEFLGYSGTAHGVIRRIIDI